MSLRHFLIVGIGFALASCASAGAERARAPSNVITASELADVYASNLYDAIRRIRPNFLRHRGRSTIYGEGSELLVYVDGTRFGERDVLRTMSVSDVREVRFFDAREATTRWGTGHSAGVIFVATHASGTD